jgi:hypothetical protein
MKIPGENEAYIWNDLYSLYLFPSLKLLTVPWVKSFLPEIGLPQFIVEQPEKWTPIYEEMIANYTKLHDAAVKDLKPESGYEYHTRIDPRTTLQAFLGGLQQLVRVSGKDTATDLEHWVRRHFLSHEVDSKTYNWRSIFCYAVLPPNDRKSQVLPPSFIAEFVPTMKNLQSFSKCDELEERIKEAMPPPSTEELALTEGEILLSNDARILEKVILQQSTMEIWKLLTQNLNKQQKHEFIEWAKQQGNRVNMRTDCLIEDVFSRTSFPFNDSPSLLDLPSNFDLIDYRFP